MNFGESFQIVRFNELEKYWKSFVPRINEDICQSKFITKGIRKD